MTTAGTQDEEPTSKTQPQDDGELITTPLPATAPSDLSPVEPDAPTYGPAVEGNPFEEDEYDTMRFTATPGEYDLPTGSGMLPPLPDEDVASPTASVGEPEETQPNAENEQQNKTAEPEGDDDRTERKRNKSKNLATNQSTS